MFAPRGIALTEVSNLRRNFLPPRVLLKSRPSQLTKCASHRGEEVRFSDHRGGFGF